MAKFIALLRGINVSGQKKIKMTDLKNLFEDLKFTNVETYIQSGNVLFSTKSNNTKSIKSKIEKGIEAQYGYTVRVILKTPDELGTALNKNPFLKNKKKDTGKLYYTFLSEIPSKENLKKLKDIDYSPEEYIIDEDRIYLFFPDGYGEAKMNINLFEKKLCLFATSRNHRTVETLFEMAKSD
jgi:uncharacterized protein (DUF1697 family)